MPHKRLSWTNNLVIDPKYKSVVLHKESSTDRIRKAIFTKLGGKCVRCGIDNPIVLQVDHVNGGGVAEKIALGSFEMWRRMLENKNGEYQLLCANCNMIKRHENGENAKCRS